MKLTPWITFLTAALAAAQDAPTPTPPSPVVQAAAGNDAFALELYARLRQQDGNLFFAPLCVRTALAMTWAGARGRTAEQMAAALAIAGAGDDAHRAIGDLARSLVGPSLRTANALWGQQGEPFLPAFTGLCAAHYDARFAQLDFLHATEAARRTINAWVAERTSGRIGELLKPGVLDAATVLVLTNAIDFHGRWATPFDPKATAESPFWVPPSDGRPDSAPVQVPTMNATGSFAYHEDDAVQVVELPYAGDDLSMVVLLPKAKDGLTALEEGLTPPRLAAWIGSLRPRQVHLALPRFSTRSALDLGDALVALGMTDAFGTAADFSSIDGKRDLFISKVVHEAFVAVDEEDTEAAAATAVVMKRGGPRIPQFRADHPFVFLIRDRRSGAIVFLGRLISP